MKTRTQTQNDKNETDSTSVPSQNLSAKNGPQTGPQNLTKLDETDLEVAEISKNAVLNKISASNHHSTSNSAFNNLLSSISPNFLNFSSSNFQNLNENSRDSSSSVFSKPDSRPTSRPNSRSGTGLKKVSAPAQPASVSAFVQKSGSFNPISGCLPPPNSLKIGEKRKNSSPDNFTLKLATSRARRSLFPTPGYNSNAEFTDKTKKQLENHVREKSQLWKYDFKNDMPFGSSQNSSQNSSQHFISLPLTGGSTPNSSSMGSCSMRSSPVTVGNNNQTLPDTQNFIHGTNNSSHENAPQKLVLAWKHDNNAPNFYRTRSVARKYNANNLPKIQHKLPINMELSLNETVSELGGSIRFTSNRTTPTLPVSETSKKSGKNRSSLCTRSPLDADSGIAGVIKNTPNKRMAGKNSNLDLKTPKKQRKITDIYSPRKSLTKRNSKTSSPKKSFDSSPQKNLGRVKKKIAL